MPCILPIGKNFSRDVRTDASINFCASVVMTGGCTLQSSSWLLRLIRWNTRHPDLERARKLLHMGSKFSGAMLSREYSLAFWVPKHGQGISSSSMDGLGNKNVCILLCARCTHMGNIRFQLFASHVALLHRHAVLILARVVLVGWNAPLHAK